jgi:hypothetical protein
MARRYCQQFLFGDITDPRPGGSQRHAYAGPMGSRPDWDGINHELRAAEDAAEAATRKKCRLVVDRWNEMVRVRRSPDPSPSVGVALAAGYRWLQVYCPACRTISQVDISAIDVHRKATLASLIPRLSCRRCGPRSPFAKLKGITEFREEPWQKVLL